MRVAAFTDEANDPETFEAPPCLGLQPVGTS